MTSSIKTTLVRMVRKLAIGISFLIFAGGVLAISILRTTAPHYSFSQTLNTTNQHSNFMVGEPVDYFLAYPGILPDHPLWEVKVIRDRAWFFLTLDPVRKSELLLLFADKRIGAARYLLEEKQGDLAVTTAQKAEKYLREAFEEEEKARKSGVNTNALINTLAIASLKHREVLEGMYAIASEEARPVVTEILNEPKTLYREITLILLERDRPIPPSPFEN